MQYILLGLVSEALLKVETKRTVYSVLVDHCAIVVGQLCKRLKLLAESCGLVDQAEIPPKLYRRITICKNSADFSPA